MLKIKKAGLASPAKYLKNESSHKDRQSFLIAEHAPDVLEDFSTLKKIALTRQNERIKITMLHKLKVIFFAFGELLQQNELLYQEIAGHKAVIEEMAISTGADPNIYSDTLRLRSIITDQLSNLKRKGLI